MVCGPYSTIQYGGFWIQDPVSRIQDTGYHAGYRIKSIHTAWRPLTSRGRRIYIYIYIWHVLVCFGNGLGSQEAPKWPPGETRRG